MNNNYDVIIIGGGLGGLTAGASLSKRGKKVLLIEQHYIPGGCATTFKRKDFLMEVGLHEMDGLFDKDIKQEIFKFLEVDKNIEFIKVPELYRFKSSTVDFVQPHGEKEVITALIKSYPNDEKGIRKLVKLMNAILTEIPKFPIERWKQILMFPVMPLLFPNIVKSATKSLGHWLDENINDEELKLILQANLLYYHDDPYSMSMIYFSAAQASYISGGGHFIKGGSQQLSNYLQQVIEQNNGQVLLGKKAERILTEKGCAIGVCFSDSFNAHVSNVKVYANAVIANAAIPLVKNLLPAVESKKIADKTDQLKTAFSLISIYIGFKKEVKSLGNKHYSTFVSADKVSSLQDVLVNNHDSWENKNFVFVDYSQIDSGLSPSGKSFGVICAADYLTDWQDLNIEDYKKQKALVAQTLFQRLEKIIPGIQENIEYHEVGTAKTIQRYTSNPEGTPYGFAQTPAQSGMGRVPFQSPIKNLYFAGAWTFPGGGFTGAIISGFLCAEQIQKKLPDKVNDNNHFIADDRVVKLIAKKELATNVLELTFEKPENFDYKVGQYAVVELLKPQYKQLDMNIRSLSMVSHPDESVLRYAMHTSQSSYKKSVVSMKLNDQCRIFGPMGEFSIKNHDKAIVFLIGGIGITPILPLLKALEKNNFAQPIYLFYSNKTKDAAYYQYLDTLQMPTLTFIPVLTKTEERIGQKLLLQTLVTLDNHDFYIVGSNNFIATMKALLIINKVNKSDIYIDDFG